MRWALHGDAYDPNVLARWLGKDVREPSTLCIDSRGRGCVVGGFYSPVGKDLTCTLELRNGLTIEVPVFDAGEELTLSDYRERVDDLTNGCGQVVVRSGGPTSPDAIVTCCSGGREAIHANSRSVFVTTSEPR